MVKREDWYAIVGDGDDPKPAKGPFTSLLKANCALTRFKERHGRLADTYLITGNVRIAGPFETYRAAANANVTDSPVVKMCHSENCLGIE